MSEFDIPADSTSNVSYIDKKCVAKWFSRCKCELDQTVFLKFAGPFSYLGGAFLSYMIPPGLFGGMIGSGCLNLANSSSVFANTFSSSAGSEIFLLCSNLNLISAAFSL